MRLKDKTAIIIGAGQGPGEGMGNGRATAIVFAREGARVLAVDRDPVSARETARLVADKGGTCVVFEADVTKEATLKAAVDEAMRLWGRIDILHNNVGVSLAGGDASPLQITEAAFDLVSAINMRGTIMACKHVLPVMEAQRGGAIINVSSIASLRAPKGIRYIAYNASKGAVNSFTQAVALMYAEKGIRCNAILPGLMHTPMIDILKNQYAAGDYDRMIAIRDRASPTGKMGTAWDTANAALFLASDESAYVNGHLLIVDGGITIRA